VSFLLTILEEYLSKEPKQLKRRDKIHAFKLKNYIKLRLITNKHNLHTDCVNDILGKLDIIHPDYLINPSKGVKTTRPPKPPPLRFMCGDFLITFD